MAAAFALALHPVTEVDLGTGMFFFSTQSLRQPQRKHDAEKIEHFLHCSKKKKPLQRSNLPLDKGAVKRPFSDQATATSIDYNK